MKNLRSNFVFTRSQQNGIFILVAIIIVLQLIYFFISFSSEASPNPREEEIVEQMQRSIDSLKLLAAQKDSVPLVPFNPNFISDYKGYMLGMSVTEIDRLHEFRKRDLWVNSAEEFQAVTGVSDSLLKILAPSFKFPDFRRNTSEDNKVSKKVFSTPLIKADLNAATEDDLRKVNGIGEKLSARIVSYRNSLGGFRGNAQLKDVYGLSPEVILRLLENFEVKNSAGERSDINSATVLQLVDLPYLNYEQARAIVKFREEAGEIKSFEELRQIKNFPVDKLDRIELYLTIDGKN
ncbi:ComEA family DNA-binding protein [Salinimicrobium xinjiangense]|uniref:ComEA family DNA-binding protein n=1 Tax=Salinimicrobium xinjiangense TaxID=438596 RepID=UPI000422CA1C|nr:helix-hairpin-helix domain-containing protein [Salinimicrobium xinjiangense]